MILDGYQITGQSILLSRLRLDDGVARDQRVKRRIPVLRLYESVWGVHRAYV